ATFAPATAGAQGTLVGRAWIGPETFTPGPQTGAFSDPNNGEVPPYHSQLFLGISSALSNGDGTYWAMPDNGFGTKDNSDDFLLRLYHVTPCWQTTDRRLGLAEPPSCFGQPPETILIGDFISLRDPNHVLTFPIVNGATTERLLTGADFDVESVQRAKDGSLWVGDEFGPFLLHFDSTGVLLDGPYEIPGVRSP